MRFFLSPLLPLPSSCKDPYPLATDNATYALRYHTWLDALSGVHYAGLGGDAYSSRYAGEYYFFYARDYFDLFIEYPFDFVPDTRLPPFMMFGLFDLLLFPLLSRMMYSIAILLCDYASKGLELSLNLIDNSRDNPVLWIITFTHLVLYFLFVYPMIMVLTGILLCMVLFLEVWRHVLGMVSASIIASTLTGYYTLRGERDFLLSNPIITYALQTGLYTLRDLDEVPQLGVGQDNPFVTRYRDSLFGLSQTPRFKKLYPAVFHAIKEGWVTAPALNQYVGELAATPLQAIYYHTLFKDRTDFLLWLMRNQIPTERFIALFQATDERAMNWVFEHPELYQHLLMQELTYEDYADMFDQLRTDYVLFTPYKQLQLFYHRNNERQRFNLIENKEEAMQHLIEFLDRIRPFGYTLK